MMLSLVLLLMLVDRGSGPALELRPVATTATVGRPLVVELVLGGGPGGRLELPEPGAELGSFVVVASRPAGAGPARIELIPTLPGDQEIPGLRVSCTPSGGFARVVESGALHIRVASALPPGEPADLRADLRLEPVPAALGPLFWFAALLVAAFAGALWAARRRRVSPRLAPSPAPAEPRAPIDPEADALARLRLLARREVVAGEASQQALAEVADVLRRYLAARFAVPAPYYTTEELAPRLAAVLAGDEPRFPEGLLPAADRAKYAAGIPVPAEVAAAAAAAILWVERRRARLEGGR